MPNRNSPSGSSGDSSAQIVIGLMGTPLTSGNRGVLALGTSIVRLCLEARPDAEVVYFGSNRDDSSIVLRPDGREYCLPVVHWRMSPRGGIRNHLFTIVAASIVYRLSPLPSLRRWLANQIPWISKLETAFVVGDVRGGDSFSDIYGLRRFLLASLPVFSVICVKGSVLLLPQTYGPFNSSLARWVARWIIRHANTIVARDKESQRIAQSLARSNQRVELCPDVAFSLYVAPMDCVVFDSGVTAQPVPRNSIGLNVNGLMFNGGYTKANMFGLQLHYPNFLTQLATQLLGVHDGPLLLVPHTIAPSGDVESDNEACRLLKESLPPELQKRVLIVTGDYDAHQLKGIIGHCGFFVGSRMHSCIAALSQGVPCVGVAYSMKFRGVFETVGMADWVVDGCTAGTDDAVRAVVARYEQRGSVANELSQKARNARERLQALFSIMFSTAERG